MTSFTLKNEKCDLKNEKTLSCIVDFFGNGF